VATSRDHLAVLDPDSPASLKMEKTVLVGQRATVALKTKT
jgi:hypothetical protein